MKFLKSIGAILVAIFVGAGLAILTDTLLEKSGLFPSFESQTQVGLFVWWMLLLALIYRMIYTVFASYLAAKIAPGNAKTIIITLGILGFVTSALGAVVMWDKSAHWYPILLALTAYPCSWWGGKLSGKM